MLKDKLAKKLKKTKPAAAKNVVHGEWKHKMVLEEWRFLLLGSSHCHQ